MAHRSLSKLLTKLPISPGGRSHPTCEMKQVNFFTTAVL